MSCSQVTPTEYLAVAYATMLVEPATTIELTELLHIAANLSALNVQSVNARYGERKHRVKITRADLLMFLGESDTITIAQFAKCIDCYLYQTSELPRYSCNQTIARVEKARNKMLFDEVDYDAAKWGI